MRPVSFKHLWTKPALLVAAGLVLLGATGRSATLGRAEGSEGAPRCEATKPSFEALYRCLSASFAADQDTGFSHVGLDATFEHHAIGLCALPGTRVALTPAGRVDLRTRLREHPVGPSPPAEVHPGS